MSLLGKAFIVTGGASGIGKSTVQRLLGLSAQVHALDLSADIPTHNGLSGQLQSYPKVDVTSRMAIRAVFDKVAAQKGVQLGGLVHCAGIMRPTESSEAGDETFRQLCDVNVFGAWNVNTEFYRLVKASATPTGTTRSIVNVGSMAAVKGFPDIPGYVASKHAVLGLSRSFALTWASAGLRVNCVAPGGVRTPMMEGMSEDMIPPQYKGALKPLIEPEEVADTILYLLGENSSAVTGQVIEVNGGWP